MKIKEFVRTDRGLTLVEDSRDIAVPYRSCTAVRGWCSSHEITVEYQGTVGAKDLLRVHNEKQRALFLLRWS